VDRPARDLHRVVADLDIAGLPPGGGGPVTELAVGVQAQLATTCDWITVPVSRAQAGWDETGPAGTPAMPTVSVAASRASHRDRRMVFISS
jgi:hypothetical protein